MPEEGFRLPGSSYSELVKIIQAYAKVKEDASLPEVSRVISMHPTQISRNTGFLVDIGVLSAGQKKGITEPGRRLANALELEMPDEIRQNWRSIARPVDFLDKVLAAVRIRKGMDRPTLQAHIVYSAGRSKTATVLAGAFAVIDVLKAAELLKEEDGKLIVAPDASPDRFEVLDLQPPIPLASQGITAPATPVASASPGVSIQIQLQVQCSPADIDELAPKLRRLIESLAAPPEQPSTRE
jgi:hypothetical protein